MNMLGYNKKFVRFIAAGALIAGPSIAFAGGYGSAGVSDAKVGQYAAQDGVWCPALEATIPETLFSQMDCGAQNVARSAVAGERVTNRSRGLFGILGAHEPRGGSEPQRDSDPTNTTTVVSVGDGPSDPTTPDSSSDPDPTPTTAARVGKWDRMNEFGINRDNWSDQGSDFRSKVKEYRGDDNFNGDWSNFDPTS